MGQGLGPGMGEVLVGLGLLSLAGWLVLLVYLLRHERTLAIGLVLAVLFTIALALVRVLFLGESVEGRFSVRVAELVVMVLVPWGLLVTVKRRGY